MKKWAVLAIVLFLAAAAALRHVQRLEERR